MVNAVQGLVTSYNTLQSFVTTQTAAGGALAFNVSLRSSFRSLTENILDDVPAVSGAFTNGNNVGLAVDKNGQLSLDTTAFTNAVATNLADVKALFARTVTTSTGLSYMSDTTATKAGTYAVNITQSGSQATLTGAGFTGSYVDSGTPDQISVIDGNSLTTATVSLATGDDITAIINKLNTAFTAQKMQVTAEASPDGQLVIKSKAYGSTARLSFTYGSGAANALSQLGITAGPAAGTDVVGTIGGVAAVGVGQRLTGAAGTDAEGLAIVYAGTGGVQRVDHALARPVWSVVEHRGRD